MRKKIQKAISLLWSCIFLSAYFNASTNRTIAAEITSTQSRQYEKSNEDFPNPERGFFFHIALGELNFALPLSYMSCKS